MQLSGSENRITQSKVVIGWNCEKAICACVFSSSKNLPDKQKLESKGLTLSSSKKEYTVPNFRTFPCQSHYESNMGKNGG